MLFLVSLSELFSTEIPKYIFCESLETITKPLERSGETYRKTKKALGGRFGLSGSFLPNFAFLVHFERLLSALSAAFRFPTFLKKGYIYMTV